MISHLLVSYHTCPMEEPGEGLAGGMNIFLQGLLGTLAKKGMQTDVITRAVGETVEVTTPYPGVRIFHVPCLWKVPPTRQSALESLDIFIEKSRLLLRGEHINPDVVSAHYWMSGVAARRLFNAPMLFTYHTVEAHKTGDREETLLSATRREAESRLAREADGVVFFTQQEMSRTARLFPELEGKSFIIEPGVDDRFRAPIPQKVARSFLGFPSPCIIFLFVAREDPGKNLAKALEAFRGLCRLLNGKILLVIAGQGGKEDLQDEHIIYLGPVPHASMALLYSAVDAVIHPSVYESFGLAPLEALSLAVPVIVPEGTFWGDMIQSKGGGLVYSADNPSGLADAMHLLFHDPSLRAYLGFAGPKAVGSFTQGKCADSWAKLLLSFSRRRNPL